MPKPAPPLITTSLDARTRQAVRLRRFPNRARPGGRLREAMASYDQLNPDVASVFREVAGFQRRDLCAPPVRCAATVVAAARQRYRDRRSARPFASWTATLATPWTRGAFDGEPGAVMAWRDA